MDVSGGAQLDISHDREWGLFISKKIGLPLKRIEIIANNLHLYVPSERSNENLTDKTNIRDWLFSVTAGYNPSEVNTKELLKKYQEKIDWVWNLISA